MIDADLPSILRAAALMREVSAFNVECRVFAEAAFDFEFGPGLINGTADAHEAVQEASLHFFGSAERNADGLRQRMELALAAYEDADSHAVERLARSGATSVQPGAALVSDLDACVVSPGTLQELHLIEVDEAELRMQFPYEPKWADLASPSSWVRDAVWGLTSLAADNGLAASPTDIYDALVLPFVGNWAGLAALGLSLQQLAEATEGVLLNNAKVIAALVQAGWQDEAGRACSLWLNHFVQNLEQGAHALRQIAKAYAAMVESVRTAETELEPIMVDLVDAAIAAALAALTAATVVGGAAFAGLSIKKALRVVSVLAGGQTIKNALIHDLDHGTAFVKAVASVKSPEDGGFPAWPDIVEARRGGRRA